MDHHDPATPSSLPPEVGPRPLQGLTTALGVLLTVTAIAAALAALAAFNRASMLEDFARGDVFGLLVKADDADSTVQGTFVLFMLLGIADPVVAIVWQARRRANARVTSAVASPRSPSGLRTAWAIAFGVSVVVTAAGLGSHPSRQQISGFGRSVDLAKVREYAAADRLTAIGLLGLSVAAILFVFLARSLTAGAEARSTGASLPPAAWLADPYGEAQLRYWDGREWTANISGPQPGHGVPGAMTAGPGSVGERWT